MNEQPPGAAPEIHVPGAPDPYETLAAEFSRVYAETKDIAVTLAFLDLRRPRAVVLQPVPDLPACVIQIVASLFYVTPALRLLRPGRHRDICSARYVAAWLFRRQRWTLHKIAGLFNVDHSTVAHGLRRVAESPELRAIATEAEARLEAATPVAFPAARPANDTIADATVPKVARPSDPS
jgi:hypothetical protein